LYEFPQGTAASAAVTPVAIATGIGSSPSRLVIDSNPAIWTTSGSNFLTRTVLTNPNAGTGFTSAQITSLSPTYGLSISAIQAGGINNYVAVGSQGISNTLSFLQGSGTTYSSASGWPVTGLNKPAGVAIDGAQNVWTINNAPGANSILELTPAAQPLSPATGFQKSSAFLGSGHALVIDSSGNVWIGLDGTNSITEIVGAAVPIWQPVSNGLNPSVNRFQSIP
jgi:hypothetical protein